jgi:hypothetical protein
VDSDLPIKDSTFHPKFKLFQVEGPGEDTISIRHHFSLPELDHRDLGVEFYQKPPWAIYKNRNTWLYLGIHPVSGDKRVHKVAVFNHDHSTARIYSDGETVFKKGNLASLTLFPTDQILLARILGDREGCYLHSSGVIFEGKGLLFVGNSEAGKSTVAMMLKDRGEILCDDRMIVRRWNGEFRIHGTWSHGEVPEVSPKFARLDGIFFLEKADENRLITVKDSQEIIRKFLSCLVKPLVTAEWWERMLELVGKIVHEVPCYNLYFDRSGKIIDVIADSF